MTYECARATAQEYFHLGTIPRSKISAPKIPRGQDGARLAGCRRENRLYAAEQNNYCRGRFRAALGGDHHQRLAFLQFRQCDCRHAAQHLLKIGRATLAEATSSAARSLALAGARRRG